MWLGMQVRLSACPPVGPASDVVQFVVLPLHSLKKRGPT